MNPIPSVLAILLCDKVIEEAYTSKKSLIGIMNGLNAIAFPVSVPMGFYARMTDGEGEYAFRVDIVALRGADIKLIARLTAPPFVQGDRLGLMELAVNLPSIPFDTPGRYEFQLYGNDVYLAHIALDVVLHSGI